MITLNKPKTVRVAIAQLNPVVGDIKGNSAKIIDWISKAKEAGAQIIAFPELAITGYPPEDLLLKKSFTADNLKALQDIALASKGITAVVGFVAVDNDIFNAAAVLNDGKVVGITYKQFLPNYGVFDENRYFQAGTTTQVYELNDIIFGVEICEDLWYPEGPHSKQSLVGGAQLIIDINSSPFNAGKWKTRERMLGSRALDNTCAIVYVNVVGGQDELVFDGHSMVVGVSGEVLFRAKAFEEQLAIVDIDLNSIDQHRLVDPRRRKAKLTVSADVEVPIIPLVSDQPLKTQLPISQTSAPPSDVEEVYNALVLGTRDYVNKNGFKNVVLGLSGGIDSALVVCVAVDALGKDRVRVLIMPSQFSSNETQGDAQILAENLGIRFDYVPIEQVFEAYKSTLASIFEDKPADVTEENIQARIRGNFLMALSNKFGALVLTTGNKSEMSCGYSTLYGDMAGGFAVIKDVPKVLVYKLCNYRNKLQAEIPQSIIDRAPSAELRPDQKDQDTLPPYEILDPILEAYVEEDKSLHEIVALGYDEKIVRRVIRMVDINEYKRRQAAPGIKITPKAFGRDRRLPITNKYVES